MCSQVARDHIQIGLSLGQRGLRAQAADYFQNIGAALFKELLVIAERGPQQDGRILDREREVRRHHSCYGVALAIQCNRSADDIASSSEGGLP